MDKFDTIENQHEGDDEDEIYSQPKRDYSSTDNRQQPNGTHQDSKRVKKNPKNQQQQHEDNANGMFTSFVYNDSYIRRYWEGRLKVFELIFCFIGMVILPGVEKHYYLRYVFFRTVAIVSFCCVAFDLFLHLFSQWDNLPKVFKKPRFILSMTVTGTVCYLAVSSLVIGTSHVSTNERNTLVAGFSGYMAMMGFLVETMLHCLRARASSPYQVE